MALTDFFFYCGTVLVLGGFIVFDNYHKRKMAKQATNDVAQAIESIGKLFEDLHRKSDMLLEETKKITEPKIETRVAKNIKIYINDLEYARDNFIIEPSEKKVINNIIFNLEEKYGKNTR